MKKLSILLFILSTNITASAQLDTNKLNKYFTLLDKHQKAMTSVCLYDKGIFVYDRAIGFADVHQNKKSNVYTQYRIGSISKMFTAVMILQLVEEKKLQLNTPLNVFYPAIKNSSIITIEQLLNHRSGIPNLTADKNYTSYHTTPKSEQELIQIFEQFSSDFEPGARYSYSNSNYILLSFILEKLTQSTYAEQLLKRVCAKANLADTKVGAHIQVLNNECHSYDFENNQWVLSEETDMSIPQGAGNIVSTAKDLCLFIEALFEGKLISKPMLENMKKMNEGYGYGMIQFPFAKKVFYGHTGGIDAFQSMLGYNEEDKLAVCIVGNGYNYAMNDIAIAMLNIYYNKAFELPVFEKRVLSEAALKSIEGVYGNSKMNMTITIFKQDSVLMAQATGQGAIPLEKVNELEYQFKAADIRMFFMKDEKEHIQNFKLQQAGMDLFFEKQ